VRSFIVLPVIADGAYDVAVVVVIAAAVSELAMVAMLKGKHLKRIINHCLS
jgi:uncharacterized membrane protein